MNRRSENGNVIMWVLIAVVLMAALAYAFTQGSRSSTSMLTDEIAESHANQIISYGNDIKQSAKRLRLRGVTEAQLSFENPTNTNYTNANCTTGACRIFDSAGGGISYKTPISSYLDAAQSGEAYYGEWIFTGEVCVEDVGGDDGANCDGDGLDNEDLVAILPYIRREICIQINEALGVGTAGAAPPQDAGNSWPGAGAYFTGAYSDGDKIDDTSDLTGQSSGCFESNSSPTSGKYHFYNVILAR